MEKKTHGMPVKQRTLEEPRGLAEALARRELERRLPYRTPVDGSTPGCLYRAEDGSLKTAREMLDDDAAN